MEERRKVILKLKATEQISAIAYYIARRGNPVNSETFADKLHYFAQSISAFPLKYPFCKAKKFERKGYRCAVYRKDYVFVYGVKEDLVTVFQVVHTLTIK